MVHSTDLLTFSLSDAKPRAPNCIRDLEGAFGIRGDTSVKNEYGTNLALTCKTA